MSGYRKVINASPYASYLRKNHLENAVLDLCSERTNPFIVPRHRLIQGQFSISIYEGDLFGATVSEMRTALKNLEKLGFITFTGKKLRRQKVYRYNNLHYVVGFESPVENLKNKFISHVSGNRSQPIAGHSGFSVAGA